MFEATREELEVLKAATLVLNHLGKDELDSERPYKIHCLAKNALEEVIQGNGAKKLFITNDDEGNGYHGLFYMIDSNPDELEALRMDSYCFDNVPNKEIALLG